MSAAVPSLVRFDGEGSCTNEFGWFAYDEHSTRSQQATILMTITRYWSFSVALTFAWRRTHGGRSIAAFCSSISRLFHDLFLIYNCTQMQMSKFEFERITISARAIGIIFALAIFHNDDCHVGAATFAVYVHWELNLLIKVFFAELRSNACVRARPAVRIYCETTPAVNPSPLVVAVLDPNIFEVEWKQLMRMPPSMQCESCIFPRTFGAES